MFQSFEDTSASNAVPDRVRRLREVMAAQGIDAFMVPRGDEHRGEYVPPSAERLAWLTGFTGSAGFAVVARSKAALFVDGRYTVQARAQTPPKLFSQLAIPSDSPIDWIVANLGGKDGIVGFDPWLHSIAEISRARKKFAAVGLKLKPINTNPIDRAWGKEQPAPPCNPAVIHPLARAGVSAGEKIAALQDTLTKDGHGATVLTAPDSICWLLNIRGSDVAHNPVVLCFAIVPAKGKVELIIDHGKLDAEVREHLCDVAICHQSTQFRDRLKMLVSDDIGAIRLDPETCPVWIAAQLGRRAKIVHDRDLCVAAKAIKNKAEIQGARAAQKRDAVAMCRFLAWLDREAPSGQLDEISVATRLEEFRAQTGKLKEISFDTISGSGPNGAIVHYRVTEATNRRLRDGDLYLVDSGAQYLDGTTDITRTIAIGAPSDEMKDRYTRVLKGHIAIAAARFPEGTRGVDLDPLARRALWDAGLDFDHGTGHGVGSYLSVHEGPQSISKRGMVALEPGMIISNEPGYYREGQYGIRLENLVLVRPAKRPARGDRAMLSFETLTLAPFDRRLIAVDLLSGDETSWLNDYHQRVLSEISPKLDADDMAWLSGACAPIV